MTSCSSDLRHFDRQEVKAVVSDSGLQRTYTGILYFTGNEETVNIGLDEIVVECIRTIEVVEKPRWSDPALHGTDPLTDFLNEGGVIPEDEQA